MAVKVSGAEFKAFYEDPEFWPGSPGETYHEDEVITVNGVEHTDGVDPATVPDDAVVIIEGGYLVGPQWSDCGPSLPAYFRKWKKKQETAILVVECANSKLDAVKSAIKAAGGKIRT